MDRWHVGRASQKFGPYPWAQLVEMARAGQLLSSDLLWQEGSAAWVPASTFADRLPFAAAAVAPAAPVASPGAAGHVGAPGGGGASPFMGGSAGPPQGGAAQPALTLSAPGGLHYRVVAGRFGFHARRAAEWNLHLMPLTEAETRELIALGIDDEDARRYHAWRRSVLWVTTMLGLAAALLGSVMAAVAKHDGMSEVGGLIEVLRVVALWVIPIFAFRAARTWSRHGRSRRILTIGWCISFAAPLLLALVPAQWRYDMSGSDEGARAQAEQMLKLSFAVGYYVTLMPAVLAVIPGIMRACLRIKVLLPQSILPGCFLVGAAPLWMFLFMVVFVTVNQIAGDFLLILGVLGITTAPVLYLLHAGLITRPLESDADRKRLLQIQGQVRIILIVGVAFLLIWVFTANVMGYRIIGTDEHSLVRPWSLDLFRLPVEYAAHSLFTMALAADLLMAMNLSVWTYTKRFMDSPAATDYDRRMTEIEEAGGKD